MQRDVKGHRRQIGFNEHDSPIVSVVGNPEISLDASYR